MGLWSKIGKTLLTAAPYIAAPFTGGASLSLAPLANKAVGKWNEHDAKKEYEKTGIAPQPSKLNSIMGMVGDFASGYGGGGGFGGVGGTLGGKTGSILRDIGSQTGAGGGLGGILGRAATRGGGGGLGGGTPPYVPWEVGERMGRQGGGSGTPYMMDGPDSGGFTGQMGRTGGGGSIGGGIGQAIEAIMNRQGVQGQSTGRTQGGQPQYGSAGPQRGSGTIFGGALGRSLGVGNQVDQSNPNLSYALAEGRAEALRNKRRQPQMMEMQDWSTPKRRPQYEEEEAYY